MPDDAAQSKPPCKGANWRVCERYGQIRQIRASKYYPSVRNADFGILDRVQHGRQVGKRIVGEEENIYSALSQFSKNMQEDLRRIGNFDAVKEVFKNVAKEKSKFLSGKRQPSSRPRRRSVTAA